MIQNNFMPEGWDNVVSTLDGNDFTRYCNRL